MSITSKKPVKLVLGADTLELPVYAPTIGYDVIDVKALGAHQHLTFDPGYFSTASYES